MKTTIVLIYCLVASSFALPKNSGSRGVETSGLQSPTAEAARAVWEQAVAAKGGRERLHSVHNILESYSDKSSVSLYVFPSKLWDWGFGPTPFGLSVEMINLERGLSYFVEEDSDPPVNKGKFSAKSRGEWPLVQIQLYYLLETQWVKPIPVKFYSGSIGRRPVDIVQTTVNGYRVDFHLDKDSHLPLEVAFPSRDSEGTNYGLGTIYATFSDYADVNGIQMPRKVGHMAKPEIPLSVQFNVEYDPGIFERPPSLNAGLDAWSRRKSKPVN